MKYLLETERLRLREFTLADTAFIVELLNTPGWLQFIGDRNVRTDEQAVNYLQNGPLKSYADNGYGLSLVEKIDDSKAIGMCGILRRETLEHPDIGFAFLPEYNGKGYAYEIASATLTYAKDKLHIPKVSAITVPDNARSIQLLEKLGLAFVKPIRLPHSEEDLLLYCN
ncbi:GNAT family N-acetyltransferase [Pontibacter ruber]|uniref:GNAT family N-acetyltransferase n=1 Tax=Pontibacter ruber TaxID=1343895 RepID=A0ABW5CZA9_9BACT|nr:GNAT family N-acetyltransferase [Pontibacter ruber]